MKWELTIVKNIHDDKQYTVTCSKEPQVLVGHSEPVSGVVVRWEEGDDDNNNHDDDNNNHDDDDDDDDDDDGNIIISDGCH